MAYRSTSKNAREPLRRPRDGSRSRARRPRKKRGFRRFAKWTLGSFLFLVLLGVGFFVFMYQTTEIPSANKVAVSQTSVITYADGETELGRIASENRENVSLDRVPKHVQHAVLAAENRSFYSDPGFSLTGYLRAAWTIIKGDDQLQGGSTVTQQLVKKTYLTDERTFSRKFKELILSIKLERQLSKEEILERYLNTVYYGRGSYGVQTASKAYFGKDVSSLSTGEAAVLASVIRNPSLYDPEDNPKNLENRYHYVLDGMKAQGWLESNPPEHFPEVTNGRDKNQYKGQNGYLIQMVKEELERRGISEDELLTGGYRVTTTFDEQKMKQAQKAIRQNFPDYLRKDGVDVGLASVEPGTGRVVAIYGGKDYLKEQLNHATRGGLTQPGSSFKPYVLATALQQGISLDTTFPGNSPATINGHEFKNSGGTSYGHVDMQTATQKSINTAYLQIGQEAGLENVVENAKKVGYETSPWCKPGENATHIAPVTSLPLGPMDVCPLAQAGGIATFANEGTFVEPTTIAKVTNADGSRTVYDGEPAKTKVFTKGVAADTLYGMSKVADAGGTAPGARLPDRPIAGKTGTSSENRSAWFVGTVPQLTTTVALYKAEGGTLPRIGGEIFGGTVPATMWHDYMVKATKDMEPKEFPEPANVGTVKHSQPTGLPTDEPEDTPSDTPKETPSDTPSSTPSETETEEPTSEPTQSETKDPPSPPPPSDTESCGIIGNCDDNGDGGNGGSTNDNAEGGSG